MEKNISKVDGQGGVRGQQKTSSYRDLLKFMKNPYKVWNKARTMLKVRASNRLRVHEDLDSVNQS